jgi:hypothetical protein
MHPGRNEIVSASDALIFEAHRNRFCANMRLQEFKIIVWVGSPMGKPTEGDAAAQQQHDKEDRYQGFAGAEITQW